MIDSHMDNMEAETETGCISGLRQELLGNACRYYGFSFLV